MKFVEGGIFVDDSLLEPLKIYQERYEKDFAENADSYFEDLVKQSGVDVEANRKTVKNYDAECSRIAEIDKKLFKFRALRAFLIVLAVLGALLLIVGIAELVNAVYVAGSIMLSLGIILPIGAIVTIFKVINPVLKNAEAEKAERQSKANELLKQAWAQTESLNALFDSDATRKLIEKTIPLLKFDDNFNMRRYDYLNGKYGFQDPSNPERSTIGILTGEILGNPFVVDRELVHTMGTCDYTGSIVITWTTTHVDSEGNVRTEHHSQTLTATITRPKPYYSEQTRLIYGNEAAPDLHFTHAPSHAENYSQKALESKVKSGVKKIRKQQQKSVQSGFTEMGNAEFDVLFGALDRDNEVQFRLLFTPLAQKNILALMKDKETWGDDFTMVKSGPLNFISSEHSAQWDMDTSYSRYLSYSVDLSKEKFLSFNKAYFKSLYFDFAPLLSIPLYQQHKPREYIYKENYPRNFTGHETEYAVNAMGRRAFAPLGSATDVILKTSLLGSDGKSDHVRVTAYSYEAFDRVEYVSRLGGDGHMHTIPVPWVEYVPISNERDVKLKELGFTDRTFERKVENGDLRGALEKCRIGSYSYKHGILCCIVDESDGAFDAEFTKSLE